MSSTTSTTFFTKSSASLQRRQNLLLSSPPPASLFKNGVCKQRFVLLKVSSGSEGSKLTAKSETDTASFSAVLDENDRVISTYRWCAKLPSGEVNSGFMWKSLGIEKIQKILGSKLCIASLAVILLTASNNAVLPVSSSLAATELPYVEKEIRNESSPLAISLAKHLRSIGARLYGAFWCSHCVHQKEIFGREAANLLDSVECYPDGVRQGTKMAQACYDIDLKYFPSWVINGEVFDGEKPLNELAKLSGFKLEDLSE